MSFLGRDGVKPPKDVSQAVDRGRGRRDELSCERDECYSFWRGDQYVYRRAKSTYLANQGTLAGSGKPDYRSRLTFNIIKPAVVGLVAQVTQRVPAYEINPSTTDPEDASAARMAEKVARYGYDKWRLRWVTEKVVTDALVGDEGFAWPYFDNTIGKPVGEDENGNTVCTGEVVVRTYGPNEVYWEPGMDFEESRWHAVEQARTMDQVYALPGYMGGELKPDAKTKQGSSRPAKAELVLVTEYLERPSLKFPSGRRIAMANGRQITPTEGYPCVDPKGEVVDEPVLHKLSYIVDPGSDRDMGMVRDMLDPQRVYNDSTNKTLEWKNHALVPQVLAPKGSLDTPMTDEPGLIIYYNPISGHKPEWRQVPAMPRELFEIADRAKGDLQATAGANEIPPQIEAGKAIQAYIERMQSRQQAFIGNLADWHSRLMRHCLYLVQKHYSEERMLRIRGRFGPEILSDFTGADLRGQVDVTVLPGSIEPRTREAVETKVLAFADRGWVSPTAAMAAINGGTAEGLLEDYELDVAWQNYEIQQMMGLTGVHGDVPIARPFDNHQVHLDVIHTWMKTTDFANSDQMVKEAAMAHEGQHQMLLDEANAKAIEAQTAQAEQLGMQNAARPQGGKPMPDQPMPDQPPA